jgi:hypothetical protein
MKAQSLALVILSTAFLLLGVGTCIKAVDKSEIRSSMERCRVNKIFLVDEYQNGKSVYPTRLRWMLHTDEGYVVTSYDGNYRVGDSIDIEVRKFSTYKRNK